MIKIILKVNRIDIGEDMALNNAKNDYFFDNYVKISRNILFTHMEFYSRIVKD